MKLYTILIDGKFLYQKKDGYYPLPFTDDEIKKIKINGEFKIIDILNDLKIEKANYDWNDYKLQHDAVMKWDAEYKDNNIHGFKMPIFIGCNDDYPIKLKKLFDEYIIAKILRHIAVSMI